MPDEKNIPETKRMRNEADDDVPGKPGDQPQSGGAGAGKPQQPQSGGGGGKAKEGA